MLFYLKSKVFKKREAKSDNYSNHTRNTDKPNTAASSIHHRPSSSSPPIAPRGSSFSFFTGFFLYFLWLFNVFNFHSCFSHQRFEFLGANLASHIAPDNVIVPPVLKHVLQYCCSLKATIFDFFFLWVSFHQPSKPPSHQQCFDVYTVRTSSFRLFFRRL